MLMRFFLFLVFVSICSVQCFVQNNGFVSLRTNPSKLSLKHTANEISCMLDQARADRERIKMEIVEVIKLQKDCEEGSQMYLILERKFMDLLEIEDQTILKISRLVNEMIISSRMGKNASKIMHSYFNDA